VSSKADKLGTGTSFGRAPAVSARRAAIAAVSAAPTTGVVPYELQLSLISENPENPREKLNGIQEMADTFESVGQLTAITVATVGAYLAERPERAGGLEPGAEYVVVDGHRRLAAARLVEWDSIRVMVDDAQVVSDQRLLEAAFIANTQRDDMSDLEQAAALEKLVAFHGSQSKTAKRLGISQAVISQRLSLLSLSPELQADLNAGARKVEHVRGLSRLSPEEQKAKADERAAVAGESRSRRRKASSDAGEGREEVLAAGQIYNGVIAPEESAGGAAAAVPAQPKQRAAGSKGRTAVEVPSPDVWSDPVALGEWLARSFGFSARKTIAVRLLDENTKAQEMAEARTNGADV
jgi:ParB family chromosome partitioning protein